MIKFNFIPDQERVRGMRLVGDDFGGIPGEIVVGGIVALAGVLVGIHLLLVVAAGYKFSTCQLLQGRWDAMKDDKKVYDEVTGELKALQSKMAVLRPVIAAQSLHWVNLLNDISDSVPKGVWIRQISFDKGQMDIHASAVSKISNEMAAAGNLVTALKARQSIGNNFAGLDVVSIQRRQDAAIPVADFILKARCK